ncbi:MULTISPECIES: SPOR domain-containing protein [unclassified Saccharicrinis]|uniref:SPOR domain-containing protein n=1 Tax=unclassified Saccharicrinis TaxID=2646859 RepID=UPI003D34BA31
MTNKLLIILMIFAVGVFSCGKKKEQPKKEVKREVVKPAVAKKDTVPPAPKPKPVVEKPENKYFLIAASFKKEANAISFKNSLIEQGFDAEVIVRNTGKNKDFYKVSYKGFSDKNEAYRELRSEKNKPDHEDVWLLIKK